MKAIKFLRAVVILLGILLSACAPSARSSAPVHVGGGKVQPDVIFTGAIESMNGNQWVVNGQTITVDQSVLKDGPFAIGDTVKVEASVADDGSVTAQRVETPSAADLVEEATSTPEDSSSTPVPGSTSHPPVFDNNNNKGNEAAGTVDAITDTSITIGGQTYNFAPGAEIKGQIAAGATVKLHFITNADGTISVTEVEITDSTQIGDNQSNDDPSNDMNVNDDQSNDTSSSNNQSGANNTNDNGSNHDSNNDHGGGSNSGGGGDNSGGNGGGNGGGGGG